MRLKIRTASVLGGVSSPPSGMEVDKAIGLEDGESVTNRNVNSQNEQKECRWCLVLQDIIENSDDKCARLESDILSKISLIRALEGQIQNMELKVHEFETEIKALKQRNQELENSINCGVEDEEDMVAQLMIENKVLDCEKNRAESEIEVWKTKFKELKIRVMQLGQGLSGDPVDTGLDLAKYGSETPLKNTPSIHGLEKVPRTFKSRIRKGLNFTSEGNPHLHISPSTPGVISRFDPISISDESDDDSNTTAQLAMPKRGKVRRATAYVLRSESETDCDDNMPISQLKRKPQSDCSPEDDTYCDMPEKPPPRRRLKRVGYHDKKFNSKGESEIEENDPSSEGESLGEFIVDDSDVSEGEQLPENHVPENGSDSSTSYGNIISDLQRKRRKKMEWIDEGDMLADFGKYPELCMEAVCALYRQQTAEEKSVKATIDRNGRGFSHVHADMGSKLAEFLVDDDPEGGLKKSAQELQKFDVMGGQKCWKLATNYSKQLWEIYKNKEDPFFHP